MNPNVGFGTTGADPNMAAGIPVQQPYVAPPGQPPAGGGIDDLEARLRALEGK